MPSPLMWPVHQCWPGLLDLLPEKLRNIGNFIAIIHYTRVVRSAMWELTPSNPSLASEAIRVCTLSQLTLSVSMDSTALATTRFFEAES
jgi:hypothetical protein